MTLVKNPRTGYYEGDFRSTRLQRLHLSFGETYRTKAKAMQAHEAVRQLYAAGEAYPDLIARLRRRKLAVAAVVACVEAKRSFDTLRPVLTWPTVGEAVTRYLAALAANAKRAKNTRVTARTHLNRYAAFIHEGAAIGTLPVDAVPIAATDAYIAWMRGAYAPGTVTDAVAAVVTLYGWLRKREARDAREVSRVPRTLHTPVDADTRPTDKPARQRFLSEAECAKLVAACPEVHRFPILCGLLGGMRVGEVAHLRTGHDVNEAARALIVQERTAPHAWRPKNRKRREVEMNDALWAAYELHRDRYAGRDYLVTNTRGDRMTEKSLGEKFAEIVTDAELTPGRDTAHGVVFHTLRHSFASHAIMRGVDLITVAELLGDTPEMVLKVYKHLARSHKREAVGRLADLGRPRGENGPITTTSATTDAAAEGTRDAA